MSIESKAKTQIDVANICDDCMSNCGSCPYSKKWVSLEDAQKEITNLQECNKFWGGYAAALKIENEKLVAKIEAAKAIMQEWFDSENWDESYDHEILCRLDVVLNNRKMAVASDLKIPRNREQKQEENSVELLHRYRNEYAEQGNEENKENTSP